MSDGAWYARFSDQAVDVDGSDLDPVRDAARDAEVWVALGVTERLRSGTLNNTVVYIDARGDIVARHRKLIPTGAERLIWGNGQGELLTTVDVGGVRVGSLICWENYMPLARAAMYQSGIDVLLAPTWDNSDEWVPTLRHIAKEGQIFVVGITACLRGSDVPRDLPDAGELYGGDDDWLSIGNTSIVAPGGEVLAGPLTGTKITLGEQPILIGRADDSTLVLTDDFASSRHARLTNRGGQWYVEDLGSTNGTYLDQQRVQGPLLINPGQPIRIGQTALELRT